MNNPRKRHVGKSNVERDFYYRNLKKQQTIDATYLEGDSISTDSPLKEDMEVGPTPQPPKKKYTPKHKSETPFYKNKVVQSIFATVIAALVILLIVDINREVGVVSERLNSTREDVETLRKETAEIRHDIKSFEPIRTDVEVLKVKISENNKTKR